MEQIHSSWKSLFDQYNFDLDYMDEICGSYFPKKENIFRVFSMPLEDIRVVFLGQDPYHGPNQAHGLSFSVEKSIKAPPSLLNMFKELKQEFPERNYSFTHGSLEKWHENGIFLLNCALTVEKAKPLSHKEIWSDFTDEVIKFIAKNNKDCVFLLLGNFAKSKKTLVNDLK
jgi:uracil-DNA glycosylase